LENYFILRPDSRLLDNGDQQLILTTRMALLRKQLYVKKSTLPNAGKGLFTKKAIPKGTRIIEYTGKRSTWKEVKDDDGKNGYIFYINRNHVINAMPTKKAFARYANDARGLVRIKGIVNNSDYVTDGLKAYIESKKDIPAGGEIFVDYGKDYWKVIRQNMKLASEEEKKASKRNGKVSKRNGATRKVGGRATAKRMQHG
jgi:SET domain-containing protein